MIKNFFSQLTIQRICYCALLSAPFIMPLPLLHSFSPAASSIEELSDEQALTALNHLMRVTEQNLERQKNLKVEIEQYLEAKGEFMEDDQNIENINRLVAVAGTIWQQVEKHQLLSIFPPDFIEELTLFAQLSRKQQIAAP